MPTKVPGHILLLLFLTIAVSQLFAAPNTKQKARRSASTKTEDKLEISNPPESPKVIDTARIRKLYMDGEFDPAIAILERGLKEQKPLTHVDSVFIFKHLGVMCAAKYETREQGKMYMHQLLMTEPTAKIMDMYASDMIYMIFKNIQDEFQTRRGVLVHAEELVEGNRQTGPKSNRNSTPDPDRESNSGKSGGNTWVWAGATGAVVAAGVVAYFLIASEDPETTTRDHSVP